MRWLGSKAIPLHVTRVKRKTLPLIADGSLISELDPSLSPTAPVSVVANKTLEALRNDPDAIRAVHERFIRSGSNVIRTANQFVVPYIVGKDVAELEKLTKRAGQLAFEARAAICTPVRLPPVSALYEKVHRRLANARFRSSLEDPTPWELSAGASTNSGLFFRRSRPDGDYSTTASGLAANLSPTVTPAALPHVLREPMQTVSASSGAQGKHESSPEEKERIEYHYNNRRVMIAGRLPSVFDWTIQSTHTSKDLTALWHGKEVAERAWISYIDQRRLLEVMVRVLDPYVDLFICEATTSIPQAEMAARAAMLTDKPVWVGFMLKERVPGIPRLASGESIQQAVDNLLTHLPRFVDGYLLNNSEPNAVSGALPLLRSVTRRPIGIFTRLASPESRETNSAVYTNHPIETHSIMTPDEFGNIVAKWIDADKAEIAGGCWGVTAAHIAELAERYQPASKPRSSDDYAAVLLNASLKFAGRPIEANPRHPLDPVEGTKAPVTDFMKKHGLKPTRFKNFYRMTDQEDILTTRHIAMMHQRKTDASSSSSADAHSTTFALPNQSPNVSSPKDPQ